MSSKDAANSLDIKSEPTTTVENTSFNASSSSKSLDISSHITNSAVLAATNLCNQQKITRSVKTPISLLQEIATKCNCQPVYDNISTDGLAHEPLFIYKVTVGDIYAIAKGNSKKAAKHAAALSLLNEVKLKSIGINDVLARSIDDLIQSINNANPDDKFEDPVVGSGDETKTEAENTDADKSNPVGSLLEITQKLSLRPPKFEYTEEEGLPHNKVFACRTEFESFVEIGKGRSKKIAKRNAALQLLTKLKEDISFQELEAEKNNNDAGSLTTNGRDAKNKKSGNNFYAVLKSSQNPTIQKILAKSEDTLDNGLSRALFEQMAKEEHFKYTYYKLGQNKAGLYQVLLQTKTNPNHVVNGLGITFDEALEQAAFTFLELIKLLCNR